MIIKIKQKQQFNMNIKIVMTCMVLIATQNLNAQHLHMGIKAGLNVFNIDNNDNSSFDPRIGINGGLIGHIHFTTHFAVQPELIYSSKGAIYRLANVDHKLRLNYLSIPILFQYMFNNGFRIQAGPEISILLQAKQKTGSLTIDVKNDFKSLDFGLAGGLSYVHPPTGFGIDLRYVKGLANINSESPETSKNQGFQLGVFYILGHRSSLN